MQLASQEQTREDEREEKVKRLNACKKTTLHVQETVVKGRTKDAMTTQRGTYTGERPTW